jgi:hypothetical protein
VKVITLTQPWASLVACRTKTIETRSWSTNYRGPLAIHAAKTWNNEAKAMLVSPGMRQLPAAGSLRAAGFHWTKDRRRWYTDLPFGSIVATCYLVDVVPVYQTSPPSAFEDNYGDLPVKGWDRAIPEFDDGDDTVLISEANRQFGDFSPGRFAWLLDDISLITPPWAATGRLGLWECSFNRTDRCICRPGPCYGCEY